MIRLLSTIKQTHSVYFLVFSFFSIILLVTVYVFFLIFKEQMLVKYKTEYLDEQSFKMAYTMRANLTEVTSGQLSEEQKSWMDSTSKQFSASVRYISPEGTDVWFDSIQYQSYLEPYEVQIPLIKEGKLIGKLTAYYDLSKDDFFPYITILMREVRKKADIIFVCLLLLVLMGSFIIAYKLSKPIRTAGKLAGKIINGDRETILPQSGTTELVQLVRVVNVLSEEFNQHENWRKQLMQDLTHELRTPLTSVLSRLEAMLDGIYPMTEKNLMSIFVEIDRLSRLVNDVEKLSEAEGARFKLNLQYTNMEQLLKRVYEGFLYLAQDKGITFNLQPCYVPCHIEIDLDRMIQVLSNLIYNAIKYTPARGIVEIGLSIDRDETVIYCKDNGIGISAAEIPYVFNRFYRVDKSRSRESGGLGVGLSIARVLTEAHGGTMDLESKIGEGSIFRIRFPVDASLDRQDPG